MLFHHNYYFNKENEFKEILYSLYKHLNEDIDLGGIFNDNYSYGVSRYTKFIKLFIDVLEKIYQNINLNSKETFYRKKH